MLSFNVIIFHGQQMLSFICYHFPLHIFCVIIYVIIYCYHFPPFWWDLKNDNIMDLKNDNIQDLKNYNIQDTSSSV